MMSKNFKKNCIGLLTFYIFPKILRQHTKRLLKYYFGLSSVHPEPFWDRYVYDKTQKKFIKTHAHEDIFAYRIVSLGSNCFARSVPTWWGIKPRKNQGEKGGPFDLSCHPLSEVVKYLRNDFERYFDTLYFDEKEDMWGLDRSVAFCHESDCHKDDKKLIIERFSNRINNLRYVLREETKPTLFVSYYTTEFNLAPKDIQETYRLYNELYGSLVSWRQERKFKLLIVDTTGTLKKEHLNPNIHLFSYTELPQNYVWFIEECHCTKEGLKFELAFLQEVQNILKNLLS